MVIINKTPNSLLYIVNFIFFERSSTATFLNMSELATKFAEYKRPSPAAKTTGTVVDHFLFHIPKRDIKWALTELEKKCIPFQRLS